MKKILFKMVVALATGCKNDVTPARPVSQVSTEKSSSAPPVIFNDEVLCYGSTGGILPYIYTLLKAQKFNYVMKLSDPSSLRRLGKDRVLKFYKDIDVSYTPKLLSIVRFGGDSARLRYKVWRYATARFIDVTTVTKDSVKIVLPTRLEGFLR